MDEDDSQDELINQNASSSKGRRASLWAISDDSDEDEEESEEGESDSGDEENHPDGEEDDEEEEGNEEEGDEEDEDIKAEDGALGGTCVDLAETSSDEDADKCPICLNSFISQPVATPESCEHYFCLDCILEWTKNANSCPVDRLTFNNIYLRKCFGGKVKKIITVQKPMKEGVEETVDVDLEQTNCEVCGGSDREDRLLLCDGCDAGYHMECLTPPLDSVPVEEWFCPECEANNRHTRVSVVEVSDTESLPSTARPATSRHQPRAAGPTRAIARTQQSERVRASVNRYRITQARTSQLAPTYLIQSTWLDDTINAVVAGLNTAVYIRDLTPRAPPTHRRRTVKRRKVGSKRTSSAKGKGATTGFRRRKRRGRRSRKTVKKTATPRSRIANNLGIVKNKKGTALPTVYQPSEHTLSNMRADIGAASLSIYGDPFGLDPFTEREEEEQQQQQQQAQVSSLLEAKRRGISRSALRSHQPVARPIRASLSRRGVDVPQSGGVVEAAPMPDLLGSILTGQSMLMMDSADVVIRRDGSLKATKPMMPSTVQPCSSNSSSSGDAAINPGMSPIQGDSSQSPHFNGHLPGSSHSSINRPLSTSSVRSPLCTPHSAIHTQPPPYSDLPTRGHPGLQPPRPNRHTPSPGHRGTNDVRASRETSSSSSHTAPGSSFKGTIPSQSQPKKSAAKPTWVDVAVLPRIPKIKRESSGETNDGSSQGGSKRISSTNGSSSSNGYGMPETGMNSLAGDKSRQQSVDQQKGRVDGQGQRHRSDGAGSSSAFSNSFSSSSSSTGLPASQSRNPSSSSSSSSVSFRISGNSWQSRRLSVTSPSTSGGSMREHRRQKEDETKRKQLRRDKQMLLASHTLVNDEQDSTNIYDPFNPTLSDSGSSDSEAESSRQDESSLHATHEFKAPSLRRKEDVMPNKQYRVRVKTEEEETEVSQEELRRDDGRETISQEAGCSQKYVKVEKESRLVNIKIEKQTSLLDTIVKREPGLDDEGEAERSHSVTLDLNSDTADIPVPAHRSFDLLKAEKETVKEENVESEGSRRGAFPNFRKDSSASSSTPTKKKQTESTSSSKSPSRDLGHKRKTSKAPKESQSSSSETDKGRRGDHHASGQGGRQKEKEKDSERSSRRSRSRERRRARSTSQSSQSNSPDKSSRKKRRSRSHSKDRKRSRSVSSSSSGERSRRKKQKQKSKGKIVDREGDHKRGHVSKDKRPGRSRSKSRSRSRSLSRLKDERRGSSRSKSRSKSRSRSRERRKDPTRQQQPSQSSRDKVGSRSKNKRRPRSRSSSKEKMTDEGSSSKERKKEGSSSKSSQKKSGSSVSSSKDKKQIQEKKKDKDVIQNSRKEEKKTKRSKKEFPSSISTSKVKNEVKDLRADNKPPTAEITKEVMVVKEIKKEKQSLSLDMFEDAPLAKSIKTEEIDSWSLPEAKDIKKEGIEEDISQTPMCGIKTETREITIKSEPSSPRVSHLTSFSTLTTPVLDAASPELMTSEEQPNAAGLTLSVKQEVLQPSDSDDDDFNVDVMLDNLDYVKSECTEGGDGLVKQEKEDEEGKKEGEQVSAVAGAKSKAPVKRVTWNIQEPEGPQPEKSASKLALYKLKLKQEGARRPSSTAQKSSQDITGGSSKNVAGAPLGTSSRSGGLNPEGLSVSGQGDEEEGDVSRKDKYLKKLHMQERAIEEVKLAIKPFYQNRDINKDEYKDIVRKAVQKVCHSKSGEINPVKVGNLVKAYVDKYKHARKHRKGEDSGQEPQISDSP